MGKISPVSAKYIIQAVINIDGVVEKPDVIGAIFGQTEGLLGVDLELRELQRSGRIGRIEVNTDTRTGKTSGQIIIPSSLDKAETAIVGAALEIIQRIGPCNAKIKIERIEDVRVAKRAFVIERAKELLKQLMDASIPDSQELADEVAYSVRVMEVQEFGTEKLPAGPGIDDSDEVIVVEGRADVLNLLKHGIKNAIAINGTSVPHSIVELAKEKIITAFVDGDRGGDLILKELVTVADIDYVTKAPDGKEVEEITKKEIHQALRSRIAAEQLRLDVHNMHKEESNRRNERQERFEPRQQQGRQFQQQQPRPQQHDARQSPQQSQQQERRPVTQPVHSQQPQQQFQQQQPQPVQQAVKKPAKLTDEEKHTYNEMLEDLIGTKGAYILDEKLNILGKVPSSELASTLKGLSAGIHAIVLDDELTADLLQVAEKTTVKYIIAMASKLKATGRIVVMTVDDLS
ncbi:DNA primase [Candidatus Woesearchaeota archaeon]|nr:DNA primase [Candidatus Woesearchaeota archaeon]